MKTPKIKKIRTGSSYYDVKYVRDLKNDKNEILRGKIWYDEGFIKISKDYPFSSQLRTLHHEGTHGIFEEYNFEGGEDEVDMFSKAFFAFIIDNPEFIKLILKYAEEIKK